MTVPTDPSRSSRPRRRAALVVVLLLALTSIGTGFYSLAVFTSTATVGSNTFTTETVVIGANPASALITLTTMLPGDSVTGALTISNTGNAQFRYAMTSASTNADAKSLRDQLTLVIKTKDTNTAACGNFNGTQLFSGALSAAAVGDPTQGAQAGDRTLAASASEILCFQATLPLATGNAFQNATTTTTFTFNAEQTANNP